MNAIEQVYFAKAYKVRIRPTSFEFFFNNCHKQIGNQSEIDLYFDCVFIGPEEVFQWKILL